MNLMTQGSILNFSSTKLGTLLENANERKSRRELLEKECVRLGTKYATDSSEETYQQYEKATERARKNL